MSMIQVIRLAMRIRFCYGYINGRVSRLDVWYKLSPLQRPLSH